MKIVRRQIFTQKRKEKERNKMHFAPPFSDADHTISHVCALRTQQHYSFNYFTNIVRENLCTKITKSIRYSLFPFLIILICSTVYITGV